MSAKPGSSPTFDVRAMGRERVRRRVAEMRRRGELVSNGVTGRGQHARYAAGDPPKGYRRKWRRDASHGEYDIDIDGQRRAHERHRDRVVWLSEARDELAAGRPRQARAGRLYDLLEQATGLLGSKEGRDE